MKPFSIDDLKNKGYHQRNGVWEPIGTMVNYIQEAIDNTPKEVIDQINKLGVVPIPAHEINYDDIVEKFWREIKFTCKAYKFEIDPMPKPRMTKGDRANYRPITQRYWRYKEILLSQAAMMRFELGDVLIAEFYLPMPKSWGNKKRNQMYGTKHQSTKDTDNITKGAKDIFKKQDKTIHGEYVRKIWSTEGKIIIYQ